MLKQIKAIIFDVDGVIFKTHHPDGGYLWSRTIKADLGLTKKHFQKIFSPAWDDVIRGKLDTVAHLQKVFQDPMFHEINLKPEQFFSYWFAHDKYVKQDILALVKALQIPCYLGTNQEHHRTQHILQQLGNYFQGCFAAYQIGHMKPELEFFSHIENTLDLSPTELLLIDDTPANIQTAKTKGWQTYLYQDDLDHLMQFLSLR